MRSLKLITLIIFTVILSSCFKDEYDFENIGITNYNPTVATPLVNTSLTLEQLIENVDSTLISTDENNLLQITFSDTLLSYLVTELIEIPAQTVNEEFNLSPFAIDNINNTTAITLGDMAANMSNPERDAILSNDGNSIPFPALPAQPGGSFTMPASAQFSSVTFSQGTLTMDITNNWPFELTNLIVEIRNDGNNALIGTFNFISIPAGQTSSDNADLTGVTMENTLHADIANIESPGTSPTSVMVDLAATLDVVVGTSNLEVISGSAIFPSQDIITQTLDVNMSLDNGEELQTLRLSDGSIDYSIEYGLREDAQITIDLPYATLSGVPLSHVISITSDHLNSQTITGSIPLAGYEFDLTAGSTASNYIPAAISASIISSGLVIPFDTSDAVVADLSIDNLEITFLDGYLGTIVQNIDPDTVALSFFDNPLTSSISLANPQLAIHIDNSIGIPVAADMSGIASYNDQGMIPLTGIANPLNINFPSYGNFNQSERTDINLDGTNSSIADILNSSPDGLIYSMQIETNPNGNTGSPNFITDQSRIDVSMDATVPIYGSVSGFVIEDTLDFPTVVFENIKEANLRSIINNEFPVDVEIQLYFADSNYVLMDSLFSQNENMVSSSSIDANGELVSSTEKVTDFLFDESKINNVRGASYIIIYTNLSTANAGSNNAKFYADYEMDIKLGIQTTVQYNIQP